MSAEINLSVYHQNLATAVEAAVIGLNPDRPYGFATLKGTREDFQLQVITFPDRESMMRALSAPLRGALLLPDLYPDVFRFGPDKPLRLHLVIEQDDDEEADS